MDNETCLNCERQLLHPDDEFCSGKCAAEYKECCRDAAYIDEMEQREETQTVNQPWWYDR